MTGESAVKQVSQEEVAQFLAEHPGARAGEIAEGLGVSSGRVSAHLFKGKNDRFVNRGGELEHEAAERRRVLLSLFAQVWAKDGRIVAVRPHDSFRPTSKGLVPHSPSRESSVPKAGATGLEPATSAVTGQRSNRLSYAPGVTWHTSAAYRPTSMPSVRPGAGARNWPGGQSLL